MDIQPYSINDLGVDIQPYSISYSTEPIQCEVGLWAVVRMGSGLVDNGLIGNGKLVLGFDPDGN